MENRFCFVAIVKNESHIIRRCIDSISNIATSYVICDTGSTDGTPEIIENYMKEKGIPGEVIYHPWKNYSDARSYLYKYVYETQNGKYLIWHDADEVFLTDINDPTSYPSKEDADKLYEWLIKQPVSICHFMTVYGHLRYKRPNVNKNNQLYRWKSPKHEYLDPTEDSRSTIYNSIIVYPRAEGHASRDPDRCQRDVLMFIDYITENGGPQNCTREVFYLAQEYQTFDKEKSIEYYKLRTALNGGYIDEKYISYLRLGFLFDGELKIAYWKAGFKENPKRLECIHELMNYYYKEEKNPKKALKWGLEASDCRDINDDDLFIEHERYQYTFDLDFSVVAYYAEKYQLANDTNQRNLFRNKDSKIKESLLFNQKFIDEKLILHELLKLSMDENNMVNKFAGLKTSNAVVRTIISAPVINKIQ